MERRKRWPFEDENDDEDENDYDGLSDHARFRRNRRFGRIFCWISNTRYHKGFSAFYTGATGAAMKYTSFVAGPSLSEINTKSMAPPGDVCFRHGNERPQQGDAGVRAEPNRICH